MWGTYLHGPVLARNPKLADLLLSWVVGPLGRSMTPNPMPSTPNAQNTGRSSGAETAQQMAGGGNGRNDRAHMGGPATTAFFTDRYELTMLEAALRSGRAASPATFEVFTRRLPDRRPWGVFAGLGRLVAAIGEFRFGPPELAWLEKHTVVNGPTLEWLSTYRFGGDIEAYREGELYTAGSPVLTVQGTFAEAVLLETIVLSILNFDSAVAAAASLIACAAGDRPVIEMGSRRIDPSAAVAAARAGVLGRVYHHIQPRSGAYLRRTNGGHCLARLCARLSQRKRSVRRPGRRVRPGHHIAGRHVRRRRGDPQRGGGGGAGSRVRSASIQATWAGKRSAPAPSSMNLGPGVRGWW